MPNSSFKDIFKSNTLQNFQENYFSGGCIEKMHLFRLTPLKYSNTTKMKTKSKNKNKPHTNPNPNFTSNHNHNSNPARNCDDAEVEIDEAKNIQKRCKTKTRRILDLDSVLRANCRSVLLSLILVLGSFTRGVQGGVYVRSVSFHLSFRVSRCPLSPLFSISLSKLTKSPSSLIDYKSLWRNCMSWRTNV